MGAKPSKQTAPDMRKPVNKVKYGTVENRDRNAPRGKLNPANNATPPAPKKQAASMAIIEARTTDGRLIELTEVEVTKSGMLIVITDDEGQQITIHRNAWEQLVQTVNTMLDGARQQVPAHEAKKKP